ncbi:hypothetical protein AAVH_20788 [Aphelenchoides avenae]|nr:hypothetical protein AAVH_20788 [Aphelenchus avenae]
MPGLDEYPVEVDDGALFDFITNFSLMPAGKPRVVALGPFTDASVDALKRRFNENIAALGGPACAVIWGLHNENYLTNMAFSSQKENAR